MGILRELFTWWNGNTIGTRIWTARKGVRVGEDDFGNVYYRNSDDTRRWAIFADLTEASAIPAEWHGWLHHTFELPPTEAPLRRWPWEKNHQPNLTGTDLAYRPPGSLALGSAAQSAAAPKPSYSAWTPE